MTDDDSRDAGHPPQPAPASGSRVRRLGAALGSRTGIAAGAGVLAVAVAIPAAVMLSTGTNGDDRAPTRATDWSYDLATAPTQAWQVRAADHGAQSWDDPATHLREPEHAGFLDDDGMLIVAGRGIPIESSVTAIDAETGEVAWRSGPPDGGNWYGNGCSPVLPGHRIACGTSTITFLDTGTGRRISSTPAPAGYHSMVPAGSTLAYLSSRDGSMIVEGGTEDGPGRWSLRQPAGSGSGEWGSNGPVGYFCSATRDRRDATGIVFDADGRRILPAPTDGCDRTVAGGGIVRESAEEDALFSDTGDELYRSGFTFDPLPSQPDDVRIGVDFDSAIDLDSGEVLWTERLSFLLMRPQLVAGATVVASWRKYLGGFSVDSGELLWNTEMPETDVLEHRLISDGTHVALILDGQILCYDAANGEPAWSLPLDPDTSAPILTLSGGKLVVVDGASITGYGW